MSKADDLLNQWTNITIDTSKYGMEEVQMFLDELSSYMRSDEFKNLGDDEKQAELNSVKTAAKYKISDMSQTAGTSSASKVEAGAAATPPEAEPSPAPAATSPELEEPEHDPRAKELLDQAESSFYAGNYRQAVELYDQVLKIEKTYKRAIEHRKLAEEYMREGVVPAIALPPEAAIAYGKAQSAARVGRYDAAMQMLESAKNILRRNGIQRWKDGLDFETKLNEAIEAEEAIKEGKHKFNQGQIEDAIAIIDTAAQASGIPRHKDIADQYRRFKSNIQEISSIVYSGTTDPKLIGKASSKLEELTNDFGANPMLDRQRTQLEILKPRVAEQLREEIRRLKTNAERATSLETALSFAKEAEQALMQARNFGISDDTMNRIQNEVTQLVQDLNNFIQQLQQSELAYTRRRNWPSDAYGLSQDVRDRYPQDSKVVELNKKFEPYRRNVLVLKILVGIVVVIILGFAAFKLNDAYDKYTISLTPPTATVTMTPTLTSTPTLPPTLTATATLPPTATWTPSPTATQTFAYTTNNVYARAGCYDKFPAYGIIPAGSRVNISPINEQEQKQDDFGQQCMMVEYVNTSSPDKNVIGWVLLKNLKPTP